MRTFANLISSAVVCLVLGGLVSQATFSLTPVIHQLRLQAAPIVLQPAPVAEFGGQPLSEASTISALR
jgi:hypothetical protein